MILTFVEASTTLYHFDYIPKANTDVVREYFGLLKDSCLQRDTLGLIWIETALEEILTNALFLCQFLQDR